ncbi:hypothetical protein SPI_00034 [Niveomyces insectorum RCEF 264]|uniref:Uncharacterized protein n=1 Tax=Niveomyces insectorum RCEF 264 TaxID=1081102 RepID=A0A167ZRT9_9HYPO|nr:hypothetical protein SPI_00034 [Niveomyces insectorum RCEF 264]
MAVLPVVMTPELGPGTHKRNQKGRRIGRRAVRAAVDVCAEAVWLPVVVVVVLLLLLNGTRQDGHGSCYCAMETTTPDEQRTVRKGLQSFGMKCSSPVEELFF